MIFDAAEPVERLDISLKGQDHRENKMASVFFSFKGFNQTCSEVESTGPAKQGQGTDDLEEMCQGGRQDEWLLMETAADPLSRQKRMEIVCPWPIP